MEVVDWTADVLRRSGSKEPETVSNSGWFDMMPAFSGGTIRPALVADGKLLKKGMASAGRDA